MLTLIIGGLIRHLNKLVVYEKAVYVAGWVPIGYAWCFSFVITVNVTTRTLVIFDLHRWLGGNMDTRSLIRL